MGGAAVFLILVDDSIGWSLAILSGITTVLFAGHGKRLSLFFRGANVKDDAPRSTLVKIRHDHNPGISQ